MVRKTPLTYEEKQRRGYRIVSWTQSPEDQNMFDELHNLVRDSLPIKVRVARTEILRYACEHLLASLKEK